MKPFTYLEPTTIGEALGLYASLGTKARILAGGQSLLLDLKARVACPSYLLSLANIGSLKSWRYSGAGELEVGALTTYAKAASGEFVGWHKEISRICLDLADRSVRNMATLGGAACQAEPRFDIPVLLVGGDARLTIANGIGSRDIPATRFFSDQGGTVLGSSDILTHLIFPPLSAYSGVGFSKFRFRSFDAALTSVFCALACAPDGTLDRIRLAVGAVHNAPRLAPQTAESLAGLTLDVLDGEDIGERLAEEVLPASAAKTRQQCYQRELVKSLGVQAMQRAAAMARARG